ncbi:MAG: glycerate kinase [Actinobacteria bacterium]|nr:glycerate kinase [Actinomycetota bacterium]MCL5445997.1 glycerate kinase [Actinomycetota bacterium]
MISARIIAAPDSFKETAPAIQIVHAICESASRLGIECDPTPMSDGGEGFAQTYVSALEEHGIFYSRHPVTVAGPAGKPVEAVYYTVDPGSTPRLAIMDCASATGLALVGGARCNDPLAATSRGVGELIMAAITAGIRQILIGLGGSACTDGGLGAVQVITEMYDPRSNPVGSLDGDPVGSLGDGTKAGAARDPATDVAGQANVDQGKDLSKDGNTVDGLTGRTTVVAAVNTGKKLGGVELIACYDVGTAFLDAARVFAPQKGATAEQVDILSQRLVDLAHYYKTDYGIDVNALAGGGAAGGLGGGLAALGARLVPGFDTIANAVRLQERMAGAILVITGEGRLDTTSFEGKVVGRIIRTAHDQDVPVAVIAGSVDHGLPGLEHSDVGWFSMEVPAKLLADRSAMMPSQMSANQTCQASVQVVSLVERYGSARALGDTLGCVKDATTSILTGHTC